MPTNVLLPQWGMGMNDGTIVKWLKQEGDAVEIGDPLCEVESAKVNSEVESPGKGTLARIVVPDGKTVDTGTLLAVILADGEEGVDLPERMSDAPAVPVPTGCAGLRAGRGGCPVRGAVQRAGGIRGRSAEVGLSVTASPSSCHLPGGSVHRNSSATIGAETYHKARWASRRA